MYKNKKILAVITARGGSKGIPRKNIKEMNGKPLIAYTLLVAQQSKYLTRVIVSTDDEEIAQMSREYGGDVPFLRPEEFARDNSTSLSVIQHALRWLKENAGEEYDYGMLLPPTAPLRLSEDVDNVIQKIVDTGADSVMSMMKLTDFSLKKLKKIENDQILPMLFDEGTDISFRNDSEPIYKRNASIYITKTECLLQGDLFGKISRPYIMPQERSVDINEPIDFIIAESLLKRI